MRQGEAVFVDSGAWIALALLRDPLLVIARQDPEYVTRGLKQLVPLVGQDSTFQQMLVHFASRLVHTTDRHYRCRLPVCRPH